MSFARIVLWLSALVFGAIGLLFVIAPVSWANVVEISLPTAMARTDLRATYGGFDLAFGVFLAICGMNSAWLRPGLLASGLVLLGFGLSRLLGIALEGEGHRLMWTFLLLELLGGALSFYAFAKVPSA